jgi:glycosyltransferase involved in cell wall biosynthesis
MEPALTSKVHEQTRQSRGIPGRDRPLNVALVHTADHGRGAEACTLALHVALRKLGHQSNLYVGTKLTATENVHEIQRFRSFPGVLRTAKFLEERLGWQYLYHPWFRQVDGLFGVKPDVLHLHSLWSGRMGYADVGGVPRLSRRYPTLMTLHDQWMLTGHCACPALGCERWRIGCGQCPDLNLAPQIPHDGTRFNWKRKQRAIQNSTLRVTTVSSWLGDLIRESPIFAGVDVRTVHNGIDEEHFYPRSRSAMRQQLGLRQDTFIVLLTGQSVEGTSGRGTGAVDYALQALAASGVDPFVLAIGQSSQSMIERWGRRGLAVPFLSDPSALAEYYSAADVTLVASLWETFGRIPAEAQMCGVPVATFATGGIPEIVLHEETGLVVERLNSAALGAALRRLHDHPELRDRMGEAAAPRARAMFSNTAIAQAYVEQYQEIIVERTAVSKKSPR